MNHHLMGSRYGAAQASKKTAASTKLMTIENLRKKVRMRVTINAIYPIKWSSWSLANHHPVLILQHFAYSSKVIH